MLITLRIFRGIVGLIAVWQVIGLLPVLTNWLPNLESTTGNMWAIAFIKFLVLAICAGAYHWLGRLKKKYEGPGAQSSELPTIFMVIGVILLFGIVVAIALPSIQQRSNKSEHIASPTPSQIAVDSQNQVPQEIPPPPPGFVLDAPANQEAAPTFQSKGWTQESTKSASVGPWLSYSPVGTRYYRDANDIIFRVYPPGVRPDATPANPFGVGDSTADIPPASSDPPGTKYIIDPNGEIQRLIPFHGELDTPSQN